jgi:hypothetical protein
MYASNVVHVEYSGKQVVAPSATINVKGDGNCFFRALSVALTSGEGVHQELRKLMVGELKNRFDHYRKYMDDQNVEQSSYIERVAKSGTWVTAAEVFATASRLGIGIYVFVVDVASTPRWVLSAPLGKSVDQVDCVYLQLYNNHYTCVSDFVLE